MTGLESVLGWFGEVAQWIVNLVPRCGFPKWGEVHVLYAGWLRPTQHRRFYVQVPAFCKVEKVTTLPGLQEIPGQVVSLRCGTEMFVDLSAETEVRDVWKYVVAFDDEELPAQAIMSAARWTLAAYTLEELVDNEADLEDEILEACSGVEERYGLRVNRVYITSAAKSRTLRLVN